MKQMTGRRSAALLVASVLLAGSGCGAGPDGQGVVATVSDQTITVDELSFRMQTLAPAVDNQADAEDLGSEDRDRLLRERALDEALDDAALFVLAREHGLIDYTDFDGFLADLQRENDDRARALAAGEIVYGLNEFTPDQYLSRTRTELRNDLIRELGSDGGPIAATPAEVREHFEATADQWEVAAASYRVRAVDLPLASTQDEACVRVAIDVDRDDLTTVQVRERVTAACDGAEVREETLQGSARPESRSPEGQALSALQMLDVGESTPPLPAGDRLQVLRMLDKDVDAEAAFGTYESRVRHALLDTRFDALLEQRASRLPTDVDQSQLDSVNPKEEM